MGGTLNAELLKLARRPALWILMAVLIAVVLLFGYVLLWLLSESEDLQGVDAGPLLEQLRPEQLGGQVLSMVTGFGNALALLLGALSVGSEFGWHTMKTIATQGPSRMTLMVGRFGALLVACLALAAAAFVSGAAGSAIVALGEQLDTTLPAFGDLAAAFGASVLVLAVWCALGAALAMVLRSTGWAIGLGLVYALAVESIVVVLLPAIGRVGEVVQQVLISTNTTALVQAVSPQATEALGGTSPDIAAGQAVAVLAGYLAVAVAVTITVFAQRDIT
jgi:ABC-type transport system involved in multi-copper enzyme maturation permease subunit